MRETPSLAAALDKGAAANLSTAQGARPEDPRVSHLFLSAGALVDTGLLPEDLPQEATELPEAFTGPASTVQPGALGETLKDAGVPAATVGRRAQLVVMDREGQVPNTYPPEEPVSGLEEALTDGAGFVAVDAAGPEEAGRIVEAAREAGATVAVASPNAPPDSANLTPFMLGGPAGLLYSPTTRTEALLSNADVAPTLLAELDIEPPTEMQGNPATVRPGTIEQAERISGRLAFVAEKRAGVFVLVGALISAALVLGSLWKGRRGFYAVLLALPAIPAGALLATFFPLTNVPALAFLILAFAGALAVFWWKFSSSVSGAVAGTFLTVALLVAADAAAGGALMRFSVLGHNPAYGARFYGTGNEYAAVLAGSLTMGLGALAVARRLPAARGRCYRCARRSRSRATDDGRRCRWFAGARLRPGRHHRPATGKRVGEHCSLGGCWVSAGGGSVPVERFDSLPTFRTARGPRAVRSGSSRRRSASCC